MHDTLADEVQRIVMNMDEQQNGQEQEPPGENGQETQPIDTIHIHYFPDAIVILKEGEETPQPDTVVETTLVQIKKPPVFIVYAICAFYLFLIFSTLSFQLYCILNPPLATVTIIPKSQTVTLSGSLQLGRLLNPITISQSQTTPTTGKGHQDAKAATGFITLYNGQQTEQTIAQGTVFTGRSGVTIETTQSASIPPGHPGTGYGTVTIPAQALQAGRSGNIPPGDVNTPIALAVFVKNNQFTGGQDERTFQTVTKSDIDTTALPMYSTLAQSVSGALQGQLQQPEQLYILPCSPTQTSDHAIGAEATQVKVTVSETCSAVAYNRAELATKATDLLSHQALQKTGFGYSLIGNVQVRLRQASVTHTPHPLVFLSFQAFGTWIYALSQRAQQQIKNLIAGKPKQEASRLLASLPGIERVSIRWGGFGDAARLPKNTGYIHITLFVMERVPSDQSQKG